MNDSQECEHAVEEARRSAGLGFERLKGARGNLSRRAL